VWLIAYLVLVLYSPSLFRSLGFVSRGLRLDEVMLLGAWPLLMWARPRRFWQAFFSPVGVALAILPVVVLVGGVTSLVFFPDTQPGVVLALVWGFARPLLVFVAVATLLSGTALASRRLLVTTLLVLSLGLFLFAVAQMLRVGPAVKLALGPYGRKDVSERDVMQSSLLAGKVWGTFDGQPNSFGSFWLVLVCLEGALLAARRRASQHRRSLLPWVLVALCSGLGLLMSGSRGAMGGAALGLAAILFASGGARSLRVLVVIGAVLALGVAVLPHFLIERVELLIRLQGYGGAPIYQTRIPYWREDVAFWLQNPLLGAAGRPVAPPDNFYLSLLVNGGVALLVWQLACVGLVAQRLWQLRRQSGYALRDMATGLLAATGGLLINGISVPTFTMARVQELYWFLVALLLAPAAARAVCAAKDPPGAAPRSEDGAGTGPGEAWPAPGAGAHPETRAGTL
jgi:hypothetical protein